MSASLQLWSLRTPIAELGFAEVGARVAASGWRSIEPFGLVQTVDEVEPLVREFGWAVPTVHAELRTDDLPAVFAAAARLGAETVVQHSFLAECWRDAEALAETALVLERAAKVARDHGMRVAWHHHDDELRHLVAGEPAIFRLLGDVGEDIGVEVDVNWAALAGLDPVGFVRRVGARALAAHVKDGPGLGQNTDQVALGRGSLDVEGFLAELPAGAPVVVSLDVYTGEPFEAVEVSRRWLQERGLA